MKVTVQFLFDMDILNVKFNGTQVESKWLQSVIDEISEVVKSYFNVPVCNIKYHGWFTGFNFGGEFLSFIIDKIPFKEHLHLDLEEELYRQFERNELFFITQKDIDNFTWDGSAYIMLPDYVERDIGWYLFHPMLGGVRVWVKEED